MNPTRLTLRNFRCYERLDLDLPDGLTSIVGEVRGGEEGVDSNGAGKSTIALAVDVALFGPEGRESLGQYQTHGSEGMRVELEFEHRGELYRVRRAISEKGKATVDFERWNGDAAVPLSGASMKETDALIAETLGMTRDTFRASSLLLQGMVAFPELEPRDRVDLLSRMLGLERWAARQGLVRMERGRLDAERQTVAARLERADADLAELPRTVAAVTAANAAEAAARSLLSNCERGLEKATEDYREAQERIQARKVAGADLEAARARLAPLTEVAAKAAVAEDELVTARGDLADAETRVELAAALAERNQWAEQARAEWKRAADEHARLVVEADAASKQADEARDKAAAVLAHVGDQECDRCGQTLGAEAAKRAAESFIRDAEKAELAALEAQKQANKITLADEPPMPEPMPLEHARAGTDKATALERVRHLEALIDGAKGLPQKLEQARTALRHAEQELEKVPPVVMGETDKIQRAGLEARARLLEATTAAAKALAQATRARVEFERLEKLEVETAGDRIRRDELDQDLAELAILERAYGRDGLPARYLETVALPHIEASATRLLTRMGAGCRVRFNTERATKAGGSKDELYVQIVWDNGDEQEYRHFSGGEKTRIALAIALALAEFLAGRDRASDLLVVDEPQFLDGAGMEALVEILRELNERVPKVMLVAHDPRLSEAFDQTLRVVREAGRSRLDVPVAVLA